MPGFLDVCVGDELEVTCTVNTVALTWEINGEQRIFTTLSPVHSVMMIADFELVLLYKTHKLVSSATLNSIKAIHNGTVLSCWNIISSNPLPEEMASITVIIQGK